MSNKTFRLVPERPQDVTAVEALNAHAFGPGRYARTAYRLREGCAPVADLSYAAWTNGTLVASIRYSPVVLEGSAGLMLGPLVVDPAWKGKGCGLALMRETLARAKALGHRWVILVGDAPYYARADFVRVPYGRITLPGPVDPDRLLMLELQPGALNGLSGRLRGGRPR